MDMVETYPSKRREDTQEPWAIKIPIRKSCPRLWISDGLNMLMSMIKSQSIPIGSDIQRRIDGKQKGRGEVCDGKKKWGSQLYKQRGSIGGCPAFDIRNWESRVYLWLAQRGRDHFLLWGAFALGIVQASLSLKLVSYHRISDHRNFEHYGTLI